MHLITLRLFTLLTFFFVLVQPMRSVDETLKSLKAFIVDRVNGHRVIFQLLLTVEILLTERARDA